MGVAAAIAALAVSLPLAITAQADDPVPVKPPADPQGNCDPLRAELATAGTNLVEMAKMPVGTALSKIPSLSTFTSAINDLASAGSPIASGTTARSLRACRSLTSFKTAVPLGAAGWK